MYQEPRGVYSDQLVNLWINKPWRDDGGRIPCRLERWEGDDRKKLIIYSHGNAENLLDCVQFTRELATSLKTDVLCYDYSGYGLAVSDAYERSEDGVNLTLQTILEEMINIHGYQVEDIILWGYSLGSGPSVYIASRLNKAGRKLKGLVLFGAYSSILDVVSDNSHEKIAKLFDNRWDSARTIIQVTCPILILHGQSDGLISVKHALKLKNSNPNAKLVIMPNIGHTTFSWSESIKEVKDWVSFVDYRQQLSE
jgi:pimeloyl-ACP methyl ester carboxylesterase